MTGRRIRHPKEGHCNSHRADPRSTPAHPKGGPHSTHVNGFNMVWRRNINVSHWGSTQMGARVETANVRKFFIARQTGCRGDGKWKECSPYDKRSRQQKGNSDELGVRCEQDVCSRKEQKRVDQTKWHWQVHWRPVGHMSVANRQALFLGMVV
ncbi:hypothetical protein ARMGADRAFT_372527 [Armillaria gallica]|uniref:Uncharacterized protein n=1 Tax=Armillaria gallica TaxID=47427 RepID=A0A2H3DYQ4_ARMGA|nr:hypothetical protein ARMGADRAFT_372527 [Armillaria gallica]